MPRSRATLYLVQGIEQDATNTLAAVAKAQPDGYTIGTMTFSNAVAPGLVAQLPYDTTRDLAPVRQTTEASLLLVVGAESPLRSISHLVAAAKAQPGRLTYASAGDATPLHLLGALFSFHAGIDIRHIPKSARSPSWCRVPRRSVR
ncbi:MAG: tripartite tricarboxylate transporter substrate-binding protein [Burkholderiales bacterium]